MESPALIELMSTQGKIDLENCYEESNRDNVRECELGQGLI